ncbi:hypothetical protein DIC66_00245 [Rhodoferax lacus]|uniref:Uncharacterized protein n=1 Tax=Rhodoferax lacus TaxID=2184758 RepID=A0A3E1RH73_9BURK|nr:hypothetical protein DIC66_00245 [Rhodoferax lacus]
MFCSGFAWRTSLSLLSAFAFVAGRVSARRPSSFLLLRQKKRTKEKATRVRVSLRCATGNLRCSQQAGWPQTRLSPQTSGPLFPPAAALLGTRTRAWGSNTKPKPNTKTEDTRAGADADASGSPIPTAIEAVPSSAALGGSGLALFEAIAEFSQTPHNASSAGYPEGARSLARLLFAYFLLARQEKVSRPPGRDPACNDSQQTLFITT